MDDPNNSTGGFDRRSALKKAAAAGAIVWVAPAITSQSAHAQDGTCTPKCLPVGSGTGTASASATCSGQGVRRTLNISIDLSAFQGFACPCGGEPTIGVTSCTSNFGTCSVGPGGQVSVNYAARGFTGVLDFEVRLTGTASCVDRGDDPCVATCTTTVSVSVFVQDRGNCNGFPQSPTATVTTLCA